MTLHNLNIECLDEIHPHLRCNELSNINDFTIVEHRSMEQLSYVHCTYHGTLFTINWILFNKMCLMELQSNHSAYSLLENGAQLNMAHGSSEIHLVHVRSMHGPDVMCIIWFHFFPWLNFDIPTAFQIELKIVGKIVSMLSVCSIRSH